MSEALPAEILPQEDIQARIAAVEASAEAMRLIREAQMDQQVKELQEQLNRADSHLANAERVQNPGYVTESEVAAHMPASEAEVRGNARKIRQNERQHSYQEEMKNLIENPSDLGPDGGWVEADALAKQRAKEKMTANAREATALAKEIGLEQDIRHGRMDSANTRLDEALTLATENNNRESWDRFGKFWNMMTPEQREQFSNRPQMMRRLDGLFTSAQQSDSPEDWARFDRAQMALTEKQRAAYQRRADSLGILEPTPPPASLAAPEAEVDAEEALPRGRETAAGHVIDEPTVDLSPDLGTLRESKTIDRMLELRELSRKGDEAATTELNTLFFGLSEEGQGLWYARVNPASPPAEAEPFTHPVPPLPPKSQPTSAQPTTTIPTPLSPESRRKVIDLGGDDEWGGKGLDDDAEMAEEDQGNEDLYDQYDAYRHRVDALRKEQAKFRSTHNRAQRVARSFRNLRRGIPSIEQQAQQEIYGNSGAGAEGLIRQAISGQASQADLTPEESREYWNYVAGFDIDTQTPVTNTLTYPNAERNRQRQAVRVESQNRTISDAPFILNRIRSEIPAQGPNESREAYNWRLERVLDGVMEQHYREETNIGSVPRLSINEIRRSNERSRAAHEAVTGEPAQPSRLQQAANALTEYLTRPVHARDQARFERIALRNPQEFDEDNDAYANRLVAAYNQTESQTRRGRRRVRRQQAASGKK